MRTGGVELEHISFKIGDFAIDDLSLAIPEGEYFVLTGPNGSGKTVLIRLIAGLYRPSSGAIRIQGRSVTDLPPWKRNIGYVPQDGVLFPNRTVRDNIRFGLEVRRVHPSTIQRQVQETAAMLAIDCLLDRRIQGLSGGERQKVSLARALVLEPCLLLLDEPVSAIDEETRDSLCREIRTIQRKMEITTVHVSHNRKETELLADRVGALTSGRLTGIMDMRGVDEGNI